MLDLNNLNAINDGIANVAAQFQEFERQREVMAERQRMLERMVVTPSVVQVSKVSVDTPLKELVDTIKVQNEILSKQVELLKEENERQKEQVEAAKATEEEARKEARRSRVFNWVTFGITTAISVAALIISILPDSV